MDKKLDSVAPAELNSIVNTIFETHQLEERLLDGQIGVEQLRALLYNAATRGALLALEMLKSNKV